jgi:hypothetical protein
MEAIFLVSRAGKCVFRLGKNVLRVGSGAAKRLPQSLSLQTVLLLANVWFLYAGELYFSTASVGVVEVPT